MSFDTYIIIHYSTVILCGLAFIIVLFSNYHIDPISRWLVSGILLSSFLSDVISNILAKLIRNSYPAINLYHFFLGVLIVALYYFNDEKIRKSYLLKLIILTFIPFSIYQLFVSHGLYEFNLETYYFLTVFVIILSLWHFKNLLTNERAVDLKKYYFFWVNSALLIYFGFTFYLYLFNKSVILFEEELHLLVSSIQLYTNIIYCLIFITGVIWTRNISSHT